MSANKNYFNCDKEVIVYFRGCTCRGMIPINGLFFLFCQLARFTLEV